MKALLILFAALFAALLAIGPAHATTDDPAPMMPMVSAGRVIAWPDLDGGAAGMGSSMGGLMAFYAMAEYPQVFGQAACLSMHVALGDPTAKSRFHSDCIGGADSPETALAEVMNYESPIGKVSVSRDISLDNVLDLTDPSTLRQLNVTTDQITGESYKFTQQIGNMARSNGYDGILAPSARRFGGTNLVIFRGKYDKQAIDYERRISRR